MEKYILLKEQYSELLSVGVGLNEIYEASPYDHQRNWDGRLTPELFNKVFHINPNFLEEQKKRFESQIFSKSFKKKIIFFTGYSGTGKTTFINNFIDSNNKDLEFVSIDYNELTEDVVLREPQPISDGIRFFIAGNYMPNDESEKDWFFETINFIYDNHTSFIQLVSQNSLELIKVYIENPKRNDENKYYLLNSLLNKFDSMDLFTILLIILFKNISLDKKVVLIFENLDIIKLDYITRAFIDDFQKLHNNCSKLAQRIKLFGKKVLFSSRFKFVFVLREASFAKNPHITDQLGIGWSQFIFTSKQSLTNHVLFRRKEIVNELAKNGYNFTNEEQEVNKLVEYFSGDVYFDNSLVNLYNRDIKKLVRVIQEIFIQTKGHQIPFILHDSDFKKYEKRGALLFWVIKFIKENEHFNELLNFNFSNNDCDNCDIGRMILNYLLNRNGFLFNKQITGYAYKDKSCTLLEVLEFFKGIFDPIKIIEFIENAYVLHKELTWVNLISIYNKKVDGNNPFKDEKSFVDKYFKPDEYTLSDKDKKILKKLEGIELSITPAGYSLIKFVLIHFEYYSNRVKKENGDQQHPLFYLGLKKNKRGDYLFEKKIKDVINIIEKEALDNQCYFESNFEKNRSIDSEEFEFSDFSFKYFGNNRSRKGVFHIVRVISSQVSYIDNFRLYLITKKGISGVDEIKSINIKLISFIKQYLIILKNYSNDSRKKYILDTIKKQIDAIEGDLSNVSHRIIFPKYEE